MRIGRRAAALALVVTITPVAGCGGSPSPLEQAADGLSGLRSGDLSLELRLNPAGGGDGVGIELRGPFSLAGPGPLPVARIAYVQSAGPRSTRATFISTGREAFVATGGRTVRLPADRLRGLRVGTGASRSLDDLGLRVDRWVRDARTADGPRLDGQATDRITGTLDARQALGDLARASGGAAGVSAEEAKRLAGTVERSAIEVVAGREDHLLRRLRLSVRLAVPPSLRAQVGGAAGLEVSFRMSIGRPNRPVTVAAPRAAAPAP